MYFRDGDLLPENQEPLIITAAPYAPSWRPDDYPGEIPVTWDEQVQRAVECYEAGASLLHIHVRDPEDGEDLEELPGVRRPDRPVARGRAGDGVAGRRVDLVRPRG